MTIADRGGQGFRYMLTIDDKGKEGCQLESCTNAVSFQRKQPNSNQSEMDGRIVSAVAACPTICICDISYFTLITVRLLLLETYSLCTCLQGLRPSCKLNPTFQIICRWTRPGQWASGWAAVCWLVLEITTQQKRFQQSFLQRQKKIDHQSLARHNASRKSIINNLHIVLCPDTQSSIIATTQFVPKIEKNYPFLHECDRPENSRTDSNFNTLETCPSKFQLSNLCQQLFFLSGHCSA